MEKSTKTLLTSLQNSLQFLWAIVFLLFPIFFLLATTDPFILPKQILIASAAVISLVLICAEAILSKKVKMRQTFLDLPIVTFLVAAIVSSIFAINRYDSLIFLVPLLFLGISFFTISNSIVSHDSLFFFLSSLVVSGCVVSLLAVFSFFKVYILPFSFTHVPFFTPFGSLLDQALFLIILLPMSVFFAYPIIKNKTTNKTIAFSAASLLIVAGLAVTAYQLFTSQKPVILPFPIGFQIAFAAISQDAGRIAQGFFFGSGIGTFFTDFTRFKQASFNTYQVWFLNFNQSSSFILELLATTGIFGILGYIFILYKAFSKPITTIKNPLFGSLVLLAIASIFLPFSFTTLALFFLVLVLFSGAEGLKNPEKSSDLEFFLVTLRKNLFNGQGKTHSAKTSQAMPVIFSTVSLIIVGIVTFFSVKYVIADVLFNRSLTYASQNNGTQTYSAEVAAITLFPYRDSFYRIFSQTNLSISNSVLALNSQKGAKPNQQVQQTALNLIQQAISAARSATTISPLNPLNWQNLASVYRSLIGFGQGADNFAINASQQAITLDSTNPQEYISLGGLYYQLGQYDNAIRNFQVAINLKPDYANGYYNLGHAYEQKQDFANALLAYQTVQQLVATDKNNSQKIGAEIAAIQGKIQKTPTQTAQKVAPVQPGTQENLNLNQPATQLPLQPTQVPLVSPTPAK